MHTQINMNEELQKKIQILEGENEKLKKENTRLKIDSKNTHANLGIHHKRIHKLSKIDESLEILLSATNQENLINALIQEIEDMQKRLEIEKLKRSFLYIRALTNEEITDRIFDVCIKILKVHNYRDIFKVLLNQIKENFKIDYVWITLQANNGIFDPQDILDQSNADIARGLKIIGSSIFKKLIFCEKPFAFNDIPTVAKYSSNLFPGNVCFAPRSMAIIPLIMKDQVIGSLNLGSNDPEHYNPDERQTNFSTQENLGAIISIALLVAQMMDKLHAEATTDELTGAFNRKMFNRLLSAEISNAIREDDNLVLIMADLDGFKSINDTHGHDAGDEILIEVVRILESQIREKDFVFRLAGDEFTLLLTKTDAIGALRVMNRIEHYLFNKPYAIKSGANIPIRLSFGICNWKDLEPSEKTAEGFFKMADLALYELKEVKKLAKLR